jgi:hypothetical protein
MLKPGLTITAAFCLATVGCASGAGTQRLEREGNASLTGVLSSAPSSVRQGNTSCAGVRVNVTHASEPSQPLGNVMVKQSRQRCLYVVSSLPSDAELRLEVSPGSAWRCEDGQAPTLTPRPGSFKLRDYETATRDFRVTCD